MSATSSHRHHPARVIMLGVLVFGLLAVRFSPSWMTYHRGYREALAAAGSAEEKGAAELAFSTTYQVARGQLVTQQARDLSTEISDPNHKIIRWRLLIPAVGHVLGLPGWLVLGLAQVGCLVLVVALVALGFRRSSDPGRSSLEVAAFAVAVGASAPFFTSMGWLGYYDAWLALALLAVAFAGPRQLVWLACVLGPWVDERFVMGLPLALCVRRIDGKGTTADRWTWIKEQAVLPAALVCGYVAVRLTLGGSGGSQTIGQYVEQFILAESIPLSQRLLGAWEGLRFGWILVLAAVALSWRWCGREGRTEATLLGAGVLLTTAAGLFTALDMSRSMVLIMPVVALGGLMAARMPWWRARHVGTSLAVAACLAPASGIIGNLVLPVERMWGPSGALAAAHNKLAHLLAGRPGQQDAALVHYATALRVKPDYAEAHINLAALFAELPGRQEEALAHYAEALRLRPDHEEAHNNLAVLLARLPGRENEALAHYREAVRLKPAYVWAHNNLAVLLTRMPGRQHEALAHYAEALRLQPDFGAAHYNLANHLATMPDRREEMLVHYAEAARLLPDNAVVHFNYARQLEGVAGRKTEAEAHYLRALRLSPDFPEAREALERLRK